MLLPLVLSLALTPALALHLAPAAAQWHSNGELGGYCAPGQCCNTTLDGRELSFCLTEQGAVFLPDAQPPTVLTRAIIRPLAPRAQPRTDQLTLRILNLNVWGLDSSEQIDVRMNAVQTLLKQSNYDVVLVQEAWYNRHYRLLASTFPYASNYGSPGSLFCPSVTRDQEYAFQLQPVDCTGVTVLSRWPIVHQDTVIFRSRIPWYHSLDSVKELFARRGAFLSTVRVQKVVAGVLREVRVAVVNTHLGTWYSDTEEKWSDVREAQAAEVLALAEAAAATADLVVVGGDLNSSPDSPVYNRMMGAGLLDPLVQLKGAQTSRQEGFDTWGHSENSWTAPEEGYRIDYLLYRATAGAGLSVRTSMYRTMDAKVEGVSISDHMGVQCNLRLTFD